MKVILTIEVPDDFEKGDCDDCIFSRIFDIQGLEDTNCCAYLALVEAKKAITSLNNIVCTSDNCPLEIQDDEQTVRFYYCESEDKYLIGQRVGNFYYAEFDGKYWTWRMSRYLPWGEDKYPSKPIELDFLTWFEGFKKKYIFKENSQ